MKLVAFVLLFANLALFGWLYTHPQQPQADVIRAPQLPASVEPLVLLRERPKTAGAAAEMPLPAPAERMPAAVIQTPSSDQAELPQGSLPATPDLPSQAQLSEAAAALTQAPADAAAEAPAGPPSAPVVQPERLCQTVGPFPERAEADAFVAELSALGREAALRTAQVEQPSGYWVYLPSMPRAEARRIIDDLAAKGVKDYFLGRQNFISLGVFTDKRSAESRVRDISALGYTPRLEPRFLTREVFWIDLEETASARIDDARWIELLNNRTNLRRQSVACE